VLARVGHIDWCGGSMRSTISLQRAVLKGSHGLAIADRRWRLVQMLEPPSQGRFGASLAKPSVAQAPAAHVIGVNNFALPGFPSGVDREVIDQLPSGF